MKINQAWLDVTALACDLRAWLQLLALDGEMAKATPKTLRYRFLILLRFGGQVSAFGYFVTERGD